MHSIKELEVSTRLTLNSQKDYLEGDNSDIVATGNFNIIFLTFTISFIFLSFFERLAKEHRLCVG